MYLRMNCINVRFFFIFGIYENDIASPLSIMAASTSKVCENQTMHVL